MGLESKIKDAVNWSVPVVDLGTTLREVIRQLVDNNVSALVVKSGDVVVGVVTDMDVLDSLAAGKDQDTLKVADFLTPCELISGQAVKSPCVQLDESESVKNAIKLLTVAGTHNLLVSGNLRAGIASVRDLLKLIRS